ncbi:hypothetical protein GCM10023321_81060 [Pseudonocardia eucalypti]|uniref:Uncharacterized protein n=1 Tax=Pseudonocardia eucalypti TaxID=648755 RepID=A0ABP9RCZ2_9PSEU
MSSPLAQNPRCPNAPQPTWSTTAATAGPWMYRFTNHEPAIAATAALAQRGDSPSTFSRDSTPRPANIAAPAAMVSGQDEPSHSATPASAGKPTTSTRVGARA